MYVAAGRQYKELPSMASNRDMLRWAMDGDYHQIEWIKLAVQMS